MGLSHNKSPLYNPTMETAPVNHQYNKSFSQGVLEGDFPLFVWTLLYASCEPTKLGIFVMLVEHSDVHFWVTPQLLFCSLCPTPYETPKRIPHSSMKRVFHLPNCETRQWNTISIHQELCTIPIPNLALPNRLGVSMLWFGGWSLMGGMGSGFVAFSRGTRWVLGWNFIRQCRVYIQQGRALLYKPVNNLTTYFYWLNCMNLIL